MLQGILPHTDGPAYHPCVAILSLGSSCRFCFERPALRGDATAEPDSQCKEDLLPPGFTRAELLLQPGSLIVFAGPAYSDLLHSVPEAAEDTIGDGREGSVPCLNAAEAGVAPGDVLARGRRVSVTLRFVPPAT